MQNKGLHLVCSLQEKGAEVPPTIMSPSAIEVIGNNYYDVTLFISSTWFNNQPQQNI